MLGVTVLAQTPAKGVDVLVVPSDVAVYGGG